MFTSAGLVWLTTGVGYELSPKRSTSFCYTFFSTSGWTWAGVSSSAKKSIAAPLFAALTVVVTVVG